MNTLLKRNGSIVVSVFLLLISCQQTSERNGQVIRLNFQEGDLPTLHPHLLETHLRGRVVGKALYEGLTRLSSEGEAELAGASHVEISPCQTQYTFTLRDHQWSDGSAVTAFQYEKAWKQMLAPTYDCGRADLFYVIEGAKNAKKGEFTLDEIGIKALDDKTLCVKLAFPAPYFLKLLAAPIFAPVERAEKEPSRFNGPFIVDKWEQGNLLVLKINPNFWDYDQKSIKRIEIQMVTDSATAFSMYSKQNIDWVGGACCTLQPEMIVHLQKREELQRHSVARARWVYINTQRPCLSSAKIRQAFSLAINRSAITEHLYPCTVPLYKPLPLAVSLCHHTLADNNPAQAKQLFEEGLKEMQLSRLDFPSPTISYPNIGGFKQLAEYLQETWEKAFGIKVYLATAEWNVFRSNLEKREFQIGICSESALYPDPSELLERFESMHTANFSQWSHPVYQEKLRLARQIPQKRVQFLREAEELLLEEMPFIPIYNSVDLFAHHPKVKT